MIKHYVHLRYTGSCLVQYTDTWTSHLHKGSRLPTHRHNTISHFQTLVQAPYPLPTPHLHHPHQSNLKTQTLPTLPSFHRIGKAQRKSSYPLTPPHLLHRPEPNTNTFRTLLSSHAQQSSLARQLRWTQYLNHEYHPHTDALH